MMDYVVIAVRKTEKYINMTIILMSSGILVIATFMSIQNWVKAESK
jgi:hypothetical protein